MDAPTKENTLYLPIKQVYFDEIAAGTKKAEYREIKETTANRYLLSEDGALLYDESLISPDNPDFGYIDIYNGGKYPYLPKLCKYLSLAVGYAKERDTMLVEVVNITFEVMQFEDGEARFGINRETGELIDDSGGDLAAWLIVYHLGEIVELKRK